MSVAPPPDPLVPIFNPLYWEISPEGAGGITPTYLNLNYLKFPYAQGLENLQNTNVVGTLTVSGITTLNDPLQVNDTVTVSGITTLNDPLQVNDTATVTGTMTASGAVILGGALVAIPTSLGDYSTVLSNDSSTKIPTTAWVQTAIGTVPTSNVISIQTFTGNSNITFPTNTQYATIMLSGAGGSSGNFYSDFSTVSNSGGAGGAGGFCYFNRIPMEAGTLMSCSFSSGTATLFYLPVTQTNYTSTTTTVAIASAGGNGQNQTGPSGNANGGFGGGITMNLTGFGIGLNGSGGGLGQATSSSFQTLRGINYLSSLNQLTVISPTIPPLNYGIGGYSRINNGQTGDVTIQPAGPAVCIVVSYSS